MDIIDRIKQYLNHKGISDYRFEKTLSLSKGYINKAKNPTADILMKMCGIYTDISTEWLLRGENSLIYKMYKEKDDENKTLIKQNAVLEERIRQLEADNESLRSQSGADRITDTFSDLPLVDYEEDYPPVERPSSSKHPLAGKA